MNKTRVKHKDRVGYIEGFLPGNGVNAYAIVVFGKSIELLDIRSLEVIGNEVQ